MNTIVLQLPRTDFTAGDTIEGAVLAHIEEPIPYRGVRVRFYGREKSCWSTGTGKHRRTHSEEKVWFDDEITLSGRPRLDLAALISDSVSGLFSKGNYDILEPGDYETAFAYQLPNELPGDYQSPGSSDISYTITAEVDLPLKFDLKTVQPLTIYELRSQSSGPVTSEASKSFLLASDSKLEARAYLDRQIVLPGETIPLRLMVSNHSQKTVECVDVFLQQTEHLRAHASSTTREYEAAYVRYNEAKIHPGQSQELFLPFTVPTDLYPSIMNSTLVRVEYDLQIKLVVPWAIDLAVRMPILINEQPGNPSRKTEQ